MSTATEAKGFNASPGAEGGGGEAEGKERAPSRRRDDAASRKKSPAPGEGGGGRSLIGKTLGLIFGRSSTTVRVDMQRPAFVREQRSRDYNGWGDGYGGDDGGGESRRHNFNVEQTRLKVMQKWEGGIFSQRRGTWGGQEGGTGKKSLLCDAKK